jgi:hypothetical protein
MVMKLPANDLPGNSYTMHPAASSNLVNIPDGITDTVMTEINPVLQICSMVTAIVMNGLEKITPQKSCKLICINLVVRISFRSNQFVAPRLRDD